MGHEELFERMLKQVRTHQVEGWEQYRFPPTAFTSMKGEILAYDEETETLTVRFPVQAHQMNAYGTMQGGFLAAAVDNTFGPLSVLVAPPNMTRHLELTFSRPATMEMGHVIVVANLVERKGRWLMLKADVRSPQGQRLVRAKAKHWILDEHGVGDGTASRLLSKADVLGQ
jgi:acyl-coenzyme A thioesterase PaaI-like protein